FDRVSRQQVDSDDLRLRRAAAHDLAPAAGSDAEIDHRFDAFEQTEALVQLKQFVGGAAAIVLRFRAANVRIVELPLEPACRRDFAALGGAQTLQNPPPE